MQLALPLRSIATYVTETLFPPLCAVCRESTGTASTLCPDCWPDLAFLGNPACGLCGRPQPGAEDDCGVTCDECLRHPRSWDRGTATVRYEGAGRKLTLGLKHGDRLDTVPMLGGWMLRSGRALIGDAGVIVPIPLHWTRRIKRRCNQSAELARWIAKASGKSGDFAPQALIRHRATASQDGKDRDARHANVSGALKAGPQARRLRGQRVLLIDDVLTTGSTLNAAAEVCRAAGATGIDILVLALVLRDETAYLGPVSEDENNDDS